MSRLEGLRADAAVLARLARGMPRRASHSDALAAFYGKQSTHYDHFRERLLQGRAELIADITLPHDAHVVELGGGTGRNLEYFAERIARIARYDVVDLCAPLLLRARERARTLPMLRPIEADATHWQPGHPVDVVMLSYALTMIPDWRAAITNAVAMLKPGGTLAVVDFHVSPPRAQDGRVQHSAFTRRFWPWWFAHDGVRPSAEHLPELCRALPRNAVVESTARMPYLPAMRVPFYRFLGRIGPD